MAAGADVSRADREGWTALDHACAAGQVACARLLIAAGGDVERCDDAWIGSTPVHRAAAFGRADCVAALADAGADVNHATPSSGWTPLHRAAMCGHHEACAALVARGARVDCRSKAHGCTPFYMALINSSRRHRRVLGVLLEGGAPLDVAAL